MKKKAIILGIAAATMLSACKKDLTSLNVNPKNPSSVPSYTLFTGAEHSLANTMTSSNVNLNIFRLIEQQWEETTYTDESNYNLKSRAIPDNVWNAFYSNVLVNLEQAKKVIPTDVTDAAQQKNEIAIADILQVYTYYYLVTTYGNIPYSQALDITKPFPKFDDQKTVYYDLLTRLDNDIAALKANASGASYGAADVIYGGDPTSWQLFANSFKLKMGITIAGYDNAKAQSEVESAVSTANGNTGVFTSNSQNAMFTYLSATPNTNPIWVDLVQSGRQDFVANSTLIKLLQPGNGIPSDPRLPYCFTVNNAGVYAGGAPGANVSFGGNSKPSGPLLVSGSIGKITNPDFPADLLDYPEVEFNLAEAAARGYNVGGTAASHYDAGVLASEEFWGVSPSAAAAYLAQPNVAFATAFNPAAPTTVLTPLQKIALQEYLALYNRGWDAWILTRRLNYPVLVAPPTAQSAFPVRFTYPVNEQEVNVTNYNQAAAAIGGDAVTTRLFWEVQ
ncbi:MAG: SusD/RagB family nutrient-binding outer membrane lipoprotein [Bacteroidetes bacterium]|nr:SusD/RagB family nutrient-binding outer membrane lipoprotein [Bacteroidota bacterium]